MSSYGAQKGFQQLNPRKALQEDKIVHLQSCWKAFEYITTYSNKKSFKYNIFFQQCKDSFVKLNESRYIALFVINETLKKLSSIDCVNF